MYIEIFGVFCVYVDFTCAALMFLPACRRTMHWLHPYNPKPQRHMGGCQKYGPFLGTLNIRGRIIIGIQKGTMILTTSHIVSSQPQP